MRSFFVTLLVFTLSLLVLNASASAKLLHVLLEASEPPSRAGTSTLTMTISTLENFPNVVAKIGLPEGVEYVNPGSFTPISEGELSWSGPVTVGSDVHLTMTVQANDSALGNLDIDALAYYDYASGNRTGDSDGVFFYIDEDGAGSFGFVHKRVSDVREAPPLGSENDIAAPLIASSPAETTLHYKNRNISKILVSIIVLFSLLVIATILFLFKRGVLRMRSFFVTLLVFTLSLFVLDASLATPPSSQLQVLLEASEAPSRLGTSTLTVTVSTRKDFSSVVAHMTLPEGIEYVNPGSFTPLNASVLKWTGGISVGSNLNLWLTVRATDTAIGNLIIDASAYTDSGGSRTGDGDSVYFHIDENGISSFGFKHQKVSDVRSAPPPGSENDIAAPLISRDSVETTPHHQQSISAWYRSNSKTIIIAVSIVFLLLVTTILLFLKGVFKMRIFSILLFSLLLFPTVSAFATPPSSQLQVLLEASEPPSRFSESTLTVTVSTRKDFSSVVAHVTLPEGIEYVDPGSFTPLNASVLKWTGGISVGSNLNLSLTVRATDIARGNLIIHVSAYADIGGGGRTGDGDGAYFHIDENGISSFGFKHKRVSDVREAPPLGSENDIAAPLITRGPVETTPHHQQGISSWYRRNSKTIIIAVSIVFLLLVTTILLFLKGVFKMRIFSILLFSLLLFPAVSAFATPPSSQLQVLLEASEPPSRLSTSTLTATVSTRDDFSLIVVRIRLPEGIEYISSGDFTPVNPRKLEWTGPISVTSDIVLSMSVRATESAIGNLIINAFAYADMGSGNSTGDGDGVYFHIDENGISSFGFIHQRVSDVRSAPPPGSENDIAAPLITRGPVKTTLHYKNRNISKILIPIIVLFLLLVIATILFLFKRGVLRMRSFFVILLVFSSSLFVLDASATPPSSPLQVLLEASEPPSRVGTSTLTMTISTRKNFPNVVAEISLPEGIEYVNPGSFTPISESELRWSGSVTVGLDVYLTMTVQANASALGNLDIFALAYFDYASGNRTGDTDGIFFNIDENGAGSFGFHHDRVSDVREAPPLGSENDIAAPLITRDTVETTLHYNRRNISKLLIPIVVLFLLLVIATILFLFKRGVLRMRFFFVTLLVFSLSLFVLDALATPPSSQLQVSLEASGPPSRLGTSILTMTISTRKNFPNVVAEISLPEGIEYVNPGSFTPISESELRWSGSVTVGLDVHLTMTVQANASALGNLDIFALAYFDYASGNRTGDTDGVFFNIDGNGISSFGFHHDRVSDVREAPPIGSENDIAAPLITIGPTTSDGQPSCNPGPNEICVYGWVEYEDRAGNVQVAREIRVELYDADLFSDYPEGPPDSDEFLTATLTNDEGYFIFDHINNDDGVWAGGRDIYVVVRPENWDIGGIYPANAEHQPEERYFWYSPQYDNVEDQTSLNMGYLLPSKSVRKAIWIQQDIYYAYGKWSETGHIANPISVAWNPEQVGSKADTYYNGGQPRYIYIEPFYEWSRATVLHEYGHYAMHSAYGFAVVLPSGSHSFDEDSNLELAWCEGWAHYFALSVDSTDRRIIYARSLEKPKANWNVEDLSEHEDFDTGPETEGRVAAALLDLHDEHNEGDLGTPGADNVTVGDNNDEADSFAKILDILYRQETGAEFNLDVLDFYDDVIDDIDSGKITNATAKQVHSAFLHNTIAREYYGSLNQNTTWRTNILVTGDVTVEQNVILTVNPGVTVTFAPNSDNQSGGSNPSKAELIIKGTLNADDVTFMSASSSPSEEDWYGIRIEELSGSTSVLESCTIKHAYIGVEISASPTINNCQISDNSYVGILCKLNSQAVITNSEIINNGNGSSIGGVGIKGNAQPNLGNLENASTDDDGGNTFSGHWPPYYDIANYTSNDIYAQNNNWGTSDPVAIDARISDDDENTGSRVIFGIQLVSGTNSIGLPVRNPDKPDSQQYTSYTLIPAIPNCNVVTRFNPVLQFSENAIYIEGYGMIGEDFDIALGEGYYVNITADTQWPLSGNSIIEPITLYLLRDLNLISIPYPPKAYTAFSLMDAIPAEDVIGWDVENQSYVYASEGTDFPIETDEGYFVHVTEDTTFTPQAAAPPLVQENPEPALQEPKKLFPKISNVMHANITSKSVTICWNTDIVTDGIVHYGTMPAMGMVAKDTRDDDTNHWVVIKDLKESETYYYSVVSGESIEYNDGLLYQFTTSQIALRKGKIDSSLPAIIYGQVLLDDGKKAEGEIIFLSVSNQSGDSLPLAALTDTNGYWLISLWNLKDSVGKVFDYQLGDKLLIDDRALRVHFTTEITAGGALQNTGLQLAPVMPQKAVVEIPAEMKLAQNFPNPFNPDTWIPYQLSEPSQVVIKIYNVQGQLIRTLDLGHKDTGYYTTKARAGYWNGQNTQGEQTASGVYFYTIKADNFIATKRLVILK